MRLMGFLSLAVCSCAWPSLAGSPSTPAGPSLPVPLAGGACDAKHNHCVADRTWFLTPRASPGTCSPVTPVYLKDGKFVQYEDGETIRNGYVVRTEAASAKTTRARDVLIVWQPRDGEPRFPESEEATHSTTRWCVMVVDAVDPANATFTIQARPDRPFPLDLARAIVERKELSGD